MTRSGTRGATRSFWLFVGPFVAGLAIFTYLPIVWSVLLSLFDARNTVTPTHFVGVRNYLDMLTDHGFLSSLGTFTVFAALVVPLMFVTSLALALLLDRVRFARSFFRSVFFAPAACSYVAAALVWKLSIFNGVRFGLANTLLRVFGGAPVPWLSLAHPPWYWLVLVSLRLWLQVGFYMILFAAGLQRIPQALYEAAAVDGIGPGWRRLRHITLPQLRATSVGVLLLGLIGAYQAFDEFYNVLGGSGTYPPYGRPPLVYLYYTALGNGQDFGHGSAGAVILTLIIATATVAQGRLLGFGRAER
jgi:multiple sugar transport system permease protein